MDTIQEATTNEVKSEQVQDALSNNIPLQHVCDGKKKDRTMIGDLLLENKAITKEELQSALKIHKKRVIDHKKTLTGCLVNMGLLKKDVLNIAMDECYQRFGNIGEYLLLKSVISKEQLTNALEEQKKSGKMIGEQLISLGYIARGFFYSILNQRIDTDDLCDFLIEKNLVKEDQMVMAKNVNQKGYRLGEVLVKEGLVSDIAIKKIVSSQHNIPFKHLNEWFISGEQKKILSKIMSNDISKSICAIPYNITGDKVDLALSDIVFLDEIVDIERVCGYHFYCCLTTETDFEHLNRQLFDTIDTSKRPVQFSKKTQDKKSFNEENYSSHFLRSNAIFIREYYRVLIEAGFTEEQAILISGDEGKIKFPGKPSGEKKRGNVTEFFSIVIANPDEEKDSVTSLFKNYIKARIVCGEEIKDVDKELFANFIIKNHEEIKKSQGFSSVKYSIIIQKGVSKVLQIQNR